LCGVRSRAAGRHFIQLKKAYFGKQPRERVAVEEANAGEIRRSRSGENAKS
jgi:hypothetical protein